MQTIKFTLVSLVMCIVLLLCNQTFGKKAFITGITGQDGSYLAEFLLEKGYEVHGVKRRTSLFSATERIDHLLNKGLPFYLHYGDLADQSSIIRLLQEIQPDEVYNLGAQSHVKVSFEVPDYTADVDALGTLRLLEAIRVLGMASRVKFYQASSSEMFGKVLETPQSETTPFYPRSPYAAAKVFSYWMTVNYRESYNMFACNGILFNHESPRRGESFVTRKITRAVARIVAGLQETLVLGNLDAQRDWGYAKDYVEAMWLMLQQHTPDDYVVATGETHSVREFVERAFKHAGVTIAWRGNGLQEKGYDAETGLVRVTISENYYRPAEVDLLLGDATKALQKLGWRPGVCFDELVEMMMVEDLKIYV